MRPRIYLHDKQNVAKLDITFIQKDSSLWQRNPKVQHWYRKARQQTVLDTISPVHIYVAVILA